MASASVSYLVTRLLLLESFKAHFASAAAGVQLTLREPDGGVPVIFMIYAQGAPWNYFVN